MNLHVGTRRAALALVLVATVGALAARAGAASVGLRVAILTKPGWSSVDFLVQTLQGYGAPYDVIAIDDTASPAVNITALLTNADGSAKYAGLYIYPSLEAIGTLTRAQVTDLRAYQITSGARSVVFGAWATNFGAVLSDAWPPCTSDDIPMAFTNDTPMGISGIKRSAQLSSLGLYRCAAAVPKPGFFNDHGAAISCGIWASDFAATGIHASCSATSILDFAGTTPPTSGAVLTTYADGRETMVFLFDCAAWSPSCMVLGHLSLAWLLRDIIPGSRRALLTIQADDVFLTTEFDTVEPVTNRTSYRLTLPDLVAHAQWQDGALKALMPPGSDFKVELPYNGNGVLEEVARVAALKPTPPAGQQGGMPFGPSAVNPKTMFGVIIKQTINDLKEIKKTDSKGRDDCDDDDDDDDRREAIRRAIRRLVTWRRKWVVVRRGHRKFKVPTRELEIVTGLQPLSIDDRSCLDMPEFETLGCKCWHAGTAACPATAPLFCRQCTKDWAKPLGSGANRVQADAMATARNWSSSYMREMDLLYRAISRNTNNVSTSFFYSHHTWSHQNLDNATAYDADVQIALNKAMAAKGFMNLVSRRTYSARCMVTPQISGLLNGDALASIVKNGITCATGDNTWPFLAADPANPHRLRYTTKAFNGYDGFAIMPRFATEIYFNCSTGGQNVDLYNRLYRRYWGADSDIATVMAREAMRVVRDGILQLRADPHMMHQANLALIDGTGKSLLMRWTEAVVVEHNKYLTWPLTSLSLDDLYDVYKAREAREACNLAYTLQIANGTVTGVSASTASPFVCSAPLLVAGPGGAPTELAVTVPAGGLATAPVAGVAWPAI